VWLTGKIGTNLYVYDKMTGSTKLELGDYFSSGGGLVLVEDSGHIAELPFNINRDWGPNQYSGSAPLATSALRLTTNRQQLFSGGNYGPTELTLSNLHSIPAGSYQQGDIVFKSETAAANFIGWACVTGGVAGSTAVFKQFGSIED